MRKRQITAKILLALLLAVTALATQAATTIYGIRGTATPGANDIIRLDPATGAFTVVYDGYPGGNAATIAQCPNGLIYYAINSGSNQLYVFNPQTPAVAPAPVGTGLPDGSLKMACSPSGILYYLTETATNNLHIINTATGTYTGAAVTITGEGAGGDIAFNSSGMLYGYNNTDNLFTIPLGGGAVTPIGSGPITGIAGSGIGLAFTDTNAIRVLTNGTPGFYSVNTGTNPPSSTSLSSPPGGVATGDLASINVPDPDLSITKTANVSLVTPGVATRGGLHDRRHQQQRLSGRRYGDRHLPCRRQCRHVDVCGERGIVLHGQRLGEHQHDSDPGGRRHGDLHGQRDGQHRDGDRQHRQRRVAIRVPDGCHAGQQLRQPHDPGQAGDQQGVRCGELRAAGQRRR